MTEVAVKMEPVATRSPETRRRRIPPALAEYGGLVAVLVLLIALFGTLSDRFFSPLTFTLLANQLPALLVVATGLTFVLVLGGIDLSVGSVMACSSAMLGVALITWGLPLPIALLFPLGVGTLAGLINGAVTVRWAVPSFIATLGMLEAARGATYLLTGSQTVYVGGEVDALGAPLPFLGLSPAFLLAVLLVGIAQLVLSRSVFGRYIVAVGTNEEAVRLAGVDPRPVKLWVFVLSGALAGLGGVFHLAYLETADPNAGIGLELSAIAAVVIGGTSLMGGRGSVVSTLLGVLIIGVLQAGLAQVGVSEPSKRLITGAVIVVAAIIDTYRHRTIRRASAS